MKRYVLGFVFAYSSLWGCSSEEDTVRKMLLSCRRIASLFSLLIAFFCLCVCINAQTKGWTYTNLTINMMVNDDGSATYSRAVTQPMSVITREGQKLNRQECSIILADNLLKKKKEWNIEATANTVGNDCIQTVSYKVQNLSVLNQILNLYPGEVVENEDGKFTIEMKLTAYNSYSMPSLREKVTFKYIVAVPNLESFSAGGVKQKNNSVIWVFVDKIHSIQIKGALEEFSPTGDSVVNQYEIYKDATGNYRWRYRTSEGKIIAESSSSYLNKTSCRSDIDIMRNSSDSPVVDSSPATNQMNQTQTPPPVANPKPPTEQPKKKESKSKKVLKGIVDRVIKIN